MNDIPLMQARHLTRHFRQPREKLLAPVKSVRAVDDVSFDIRGGETLALVGESGCGKTTVGRLVLGLEQPTGGEVLFEGQCVSGVSGSAWRAQRQRMQMVFQDPLGALDPRLRVAEQIREPLDIHRIGARTARTQRVEEMLSAVGLSRELGTRYAHELSGGQQQRVNVARALILSPKLIVCDEPVSALDVSVQAQVVNLFASIQQAHGVAYLFISHDLKVVRHLAHRVAVMYLGQLVEVAEREALFAQPRHPYTRALIAAVPVPDPDARRETRLVRGDPPSAIDPPSGCRFHTRCPLVEPICRTTSPPLETIDAAHAVACHVAAREARARATTEAVSC